MSARSYRGPITAPARTSDLVPLGGNRRAKGMSRAAGTSATMTTAVKSQAMLPDFPSCVKHQSLMVGYRIAVP